MSVREEELLLPNSVSRDEPKLGGSSQSPSPCDSEKSGIGGLPGPPLSGIRR